jgi:NADPH-dependent 2,4-dienoyl-CoA reductase/sulfur reductase-like enzyme
VTGTIVVIGAGLGGLRTAEKLRAAGWSGALRVVGAERHFPYNRPPLTKEALRDDLGHEQVQLRRRSSVDDVEWLLGRVAVQVDLRARLVRLDDGTIAAYDGLVLATGVGPRRLGLGRDPACHVVRTIEDAIALRSALSVASRAVVIGAGFIGCEVASVARSLGIHVTVVDPLTVPLEGQLGSLVGGEIGRRLGETGVDLRPSCTVTSVVQHAAGSTVTLEDGTVMEADVVVEAVGSIPRVSLLDGQGLDLSDGVLCDADMHPILDGAPLRDVVAVGDIARVPLWLLGGEPRRIEHWSMAVDTAGHAARSLLEGMTGVAPSSTFAPVPSFWSDLGATRVQSFGIPTAGLGDVRVLEGDLRAGCAVGYHRDDRLVGVVLLDFAAEQMRFRSLLLHDAQVSVASA